MSYLSFIDIHLSLPSNGLHGRKEMFYFTIHSTHFFLLWLYGIGHMVEGLFMWQDKKLAAAPTWATLSD